MKFLVFLFFSLSTGLIWAAPTCHSLLEQASLQTPMSSLQMSTLARLEASIKSLENTPEPKVIQSDLIKLRHSKTGVRSLFLKMDKDYTWATNIWFLIQTEVFPSIDTESPDYVRSVENFYHQLREHLDTSKSFDVLLRKAKAQNKSGKAAAIELIKLMKKTEVFLESFTGKPVDLFSTEGVLKAFGVESVEQIAPHFTHLAKLNLELNSRIENLLDNNNVTIPKDAVFQAAKNLYPDIENNIGIRSDEGAFFRRNANEEEILSLLSLLNLEPSQHEYIKSQINLIKKATSLHDAYKHLAYSFLLFHAYELSTGERAPLPEDPFKPTAEFKSAYLITKSRILQAELVKVLMETQFQNYIDKTDQLNARFDFAKERLDRRSSAEGHEALIEKIKDALPTDRLNDFDADLKGFENQVLRAEVLLDQLREEQLKAKRNQDITNFEDLNNRWQRLLPNKVYEFDGAVDFAAVSFSPEVINAFENDPALGSRYLILLSKGRYVKPKKESGLRFLKSIHPQFRDIKLVSGKGKKRIVGKLVDDIVYFFYVYDSEKPYNSKEIGRLVENFNP